MSHLIVRGHGLAARIVTVDRVTATQVVVDVGHSAPMRFNRETGRQVGDQGSISLLHPDSDRGREWARQAKVDQARSRAQVAVRRLRDALDEPHHTEDEIVGFLAKATADVAHYLDLNRAPADGGRP